MIPIWYHYRTRLNLKLLSRNTDYAVRAVCYMAKDKKRIFSVRELVDALKMPRPFLRKILQVLNNKGLLRSYKGIGGGFRLARKAENIYLIDMIEAFQGPFKLNECFFKRKICPNRSSCSLKRKIDTIEGMVYKELKSITIGSILKGG
ncbi:MAG: Rrf2 family transcriptional regulator [Candidatus Omnitrophota bacterium]|nr:Rrf2 family transcriptional regulator [Candidatus Omnitrophota bacterium]